MSTVLLVLHVLAAVLAVGPVTVAASAFPPSLRRAAVTAAEDGGDGLGPARALHRISRVYSWVGISVPALGIATAVSMGVLGDAWVLTSLILTAVAAGVLVTRVLPGQQEALELAGRGEGPGGTGTVPAGTLRALGMSTGAFSLLWTVVVVLMIVRPGSTTGA